MSEGVLVSNKKFPKLPTIAPFDVERGPWIYDDCGRQLPVIAVTRRRVIVAAGRERVTLKRRHLQRDGFDTVGDVHIYVSRYHAQEEIA